MEIAVGIVFLIAGVGVTCLAMLLVRNSIRRLRTWTKTRGTVVDYVSSNRGRRVFYRPQIQFLSTDGQSITFASRVGSNRRPYRVGHEVSVLFDPRDFQNADLCTFANLWILPLFTTFLGVVFASIALGILFHV